MQSKDTPRQRTAASPQPSAEVAPDEAPPVPQASRVGAPLPPGDLRLLQRAVGNRAVGRLIQRRGAVIQRVKGLIPDTYVQVKDEDTEWYGQIVRAAANSYDIRVGGTDSVVTVPEGQVTLHPTAKALSDRQNQQWRKDPTTLYSILNQASADAAMDVDELELRTQSPGGLFGTVVSSDNLVNIVSRLKDQAKQDEDVKSLLVQLIIQNQPAFQGREAFVGQNLHMLLNTDVIKQMMPPQYVGLLQQQKEISGSCGATAEMLMALVAKNGKAAPMEKDKGIDEIIDKLLGEKALHWYCRISRRPHAFVVERLGGWGKIYQSYFGVYPLVDDMRKGSVYPIRTLLEQLRRCLKNQEASLEEKKALFHTSPAFNGPTDYQLNADPAPPEQILGQVSAQLERNQEDWQEYLTGAKSETPLGELFAEQQADVPQGQAQGVSIQYMDSFRLETECTEDAEGTVECSGDKSYAVGTTIYWYNPSTAAREPMLIKAFKDEQYTVEAV